MVHVSGIICNDPVGPDSRRAVRYRPLDEICHSANDTARQEAGEAPGGAVLLTMMGSLTLTAHHRRLPCNAHRLPHNGLGLSVVVGGRRQRLRSVCSERASASDFLLSIAAEPLTLFTHDEGK